jgi:hypothetical protein
MGMDIATGQTENLSATSPQQVVVVAPPTPTYPGRVPTETMPVADTAGQWQGQLLAGTADAAAAQAHAHTADNDRRTGYDLDMRPAGLQLR